MHLPSRVALAVALLAPLASLAADPSAPVFTDPEETGIEYELQGEYLGQVDLDDGPQRIGAQVIALGKNRFRLVGYFGGLPGDGWTRDDGINSTEGELEGKSVRFEFEGEGIVAVLTPGQIKVSHGDHLGSLKKVTRKSPTLGARPPAAAVVLFDGKHADAWENGQLTEDKLLAATNVSSKARFGDHRLHIEFQTPFMPESRGQARGNSGVYVQSRYEVQVLDSFGLEGKNNECGGIYSIAEPDVNMCFPPLSWQTYDIDFTAARYNDRGEKAINARVTIRHNGVVIHDDVELKHGTPGRHPEGPESDGLFLQHHGNPVLFRNIWVVEE